MLIEGSLHGGRGFDALERRFKPPALEFGRDQQRIILGVLHHQHSQRATHNNHYFPLAELRRPNATISQSR